MSLWHLRNEEKSPKLSFVATLTNDYFECRHPRHQLEKGFQIMGLNLILPLSRPYNNHSHILLYICHASWKVSYFVIFIHITIIFITAWQNWRYQTSWLYMIFHMPQRSYIDSAISHYSYLPTQQEKIKWFTCWRCTSLTSLWTLVLDVLGMSLASSISREYYCSNNSASAAHKVLCCFRYTYTYQLINLPSINDSAPPMSLNIGLYQCAL